MKSFYRFGVFVLVLFALQLPGTTAAESFRLSKTHDFAQPSGIFPTGPLVRGANGRLYGLAAGGTLPGEIFGGGVIYSVNANGEDYQVLRTFVSSTDGGGPEGRLLVATDGKFYGVCKSVGPNGGGTVFRLNQDGSGFEVLKSFIPAAAGTSSASEDGHEPSIGLIQATDGNIYGTTRRGGLSNRGTIFRLVFSGASVTFERLLSFNSFGLREAFTELLEGSDGKLYGTTFEGGSGGRGVLYRVGKDGLGFETVHSFTSAEGQGGTLYLAENPAGVIFGTATSLSNCSLFSFDPSAPLASGYQTLTTFQSGVADQRLSFAFDSFASDGLLYGGGLLFDTDFFEALSGQIARIRPDGTGLETLVTLNEAQGITPSAPLFESAPGVFIGVTSSGGAQFSGTIFRLSSGPLAGGLPTSLKTVGLKKKTDSAKVTVKGKSTGGEDFVVEFRVGTKGKFKPTRGTSTWSFTAKLKPGKNFVFIRARLSDGTVSRAVKKTLIRE